MKNIIAILILAAVSAAANTNMIRLESSITNIVIEPSYPGTIQVGTNFYRLSDLRPAYPVQWAMNSFSALHTTNIAFRCDFFGHRWEPGCGMSGCLVIHGDQPMRHCKDCKVTQTRDLGPWK